ncbi:hypothetical protein RRG08_035162 [Elysia crispata]|uniref:Uncharacterized protein n=1 Tax=Elysia crispata TaxID=231223 RepID=A0AAE0Z376_9GAST|nr:hypothetical protein RRG08_035162 [Elysia crispata]
MQPPNEHSGEDEEEDGVPVLPQVLSKAVIQALAQVRVFVMQQGETTASNKTLQEVIAMEHSVQELVTVAKKKKNNNWFLFPVHYPPNLS